MSDPWLTIIGIGEDGPDGLSQASREALAAAEIVWGAPRHLALASVGPRGRVWPVPFDLGPMLAARGQPVAMLVSGDPFWHGAGGSVAARLSPGEWRAFPVAGTFSLVAARMGWRLDDVRCLGLHAAPFGQLRAVLAHGVQAICTLRDPEAVPALAAWLRENGFAETRITICEALGGPRERVREGADWSDIAGPVAVALDGTDLPRGAGLPRTAGLPEALFAHDGQITKSSVRALTLAALAPRPGELLWDIGAGSGSVSAEWCLAGGRAIAIERHSDRVANIRRNAEAFGVAHRLTVIEGPAPEALAGLDEADAIFIGGGADAVLDLLMEGFGATAEGGAAPDPAGLPRGIWPERSHFPRLVVNAVTLETEARLVALSAAHGGRLLRIELAEAAPLGGFRGWRPLRPIVQWSWP